MPTYIYRREDGTTFEIDQRITEDALETCPTTGQPVVRVITGGTGLIFKGSGFYLTDYARQNGSSKSTSEKNGTDSSSGDTTSKSDATSTSDTTTSKDTSTAKGKE